MKTIGEKIQEIRKQKGFSIKELEKQTKIKSSFISAIENNDWESLPEFPVLQGFIKNIANNLNIDTQQAVALLRRDYPPKKLRVNPKPDLKSKFQWSPRTTFLLGIILVVFIVLGYLGFQYYQFTQPPMLEVIRPEQGQEVFLEQIVVEGDTDPEATLLINNQPTVVNEDGSFYTEIDISSQTTEIVVQATSRSERQTTVIRQISPVLDE